MALIFYQSGNQGFTKILLSTKDAQELQIMKNNNRLYNLLAAGSLTILLALIFLLFRGNGFSAAAGAANVWTGTTPAVVTSGSAVDPALANEAVETVTQADPAQNVALTTLQAQNAKLTQMLQVMQEREKQYQSQLNAASQAMQATQAQPAQRYEGYEHREHESDEHESDEHEFGEHEAGEHRADD